MADSVQKRVLDQWMDCWDEFWWLVGFFRRMQRAVGTCFLVEWL